MSWQARRVTLTSDLNNGSITAKASNVLLKLGYVSTFHLRSNYNGHNATLPLVPIILHTLYRVNSAWSDLNPEICAVNWCRPTCICVVCQSCIKLPWLLGPYTEIRRSIQLKQRGSIYLPRSLLISGDSMYQQ
jgi:hypothetical protein